ncbi:MAG TPA: DUF72 domain-containing protein [Herpetosiphonaceae bacterium]
MLVATLGGTLTMTAYIGTSGWSYDHWHGVLYPPGVPQRERLAYYVQHYQTVEVNSTFYQWPADHVFASWYRRVPHTFCLSVKAPRGLTHGRRLYAPEAWLLRINRSLRFLGHKRGVLLVQTPPDLAYDHARLAYFLEQLPPGLQVALEFRHVSWHHEAVFDLLEQWGAAYCVMSGAGLPCILRATAFCVYVRLHGPDRDRLYTGSYTDDDLRWWAERLREWMGQGRSVFVYFNNDGYGHAVHNARTLHNLLNG